MHFGHISIRPVPKDDAVIELVEYMIHRLHHDGRLVRFHNPFVVMEDCLVVCCEMPDKSSLYEWRNNKWASKLEAAGFSIQIRVLGPVLNRRETCACTRRSFYILAGAMDMPIQCGSCGNPIPLYSLPWECTDDDNFYRLNCWNKINLAWSDLEFYSENEQQAQDELGDLNSFLNKEAQELQSMIEEKTGKPCFIFLEELRENKTRKELAKSGCPGCGKEWYLESPLLKRFDFQCESCRLLSQMPPGVYE